MYITVIHVKPINFVNTIIQPWWGSILEWVVFNERDRPWVIDKKFGSKMN